MEKLKFFELEGLFLVYMFLHFTSFLVWGFYFVASINQNFTANLIQSILIIIVSDFFACILILVTASFFYLRTEEKFVFWIVYSAFTVIILMFSIKAYLTISSAIT